MGNLRDPTIYSTNVERLFVARLHEGGLTEGSNYAEEVQHSFKAVLSQSGAQGVAHQAQEQKKEVGARRVCAEDFRCAAPFLTPTLTTRDCAKVQVPVLFPKTEDQTKNTRVVGPRSNAVNSRIKLFL